MENKITGISSVRAVSVNLVQLPDNIPVILLINLRKYAVTEHVVLPDSNGSECVCHPVVIVETVTQRHDHG